MNTRTVAQEMINSIFRTDEEGFKSHFTVAADTIKNGIVADPEHSLNELTVSISFHDSIEYNHQVDVELAIDWSQSQDGYDFELTPVKATYWNGTGNTEVDLLKPIHADLSVTILSRALPVIIESDALADTKKDLEDTAEFGW